MTDATQELDVKAIIQRAGGAKRLSERSAELARCHQAKFVAEKTIYSWIESGIPEKHWGFVMPECGVTEEVLHRCNEEIRRRPRSSGRPRKRSEMAAA
jgi:hypothetical protein